MLCNSCGHSHEEHEHYLEDGVGLGWCKREDCSCRLFRQPGDADAYESTRELIKGAIDETRELVNSLPDELPALMKKSAAADLLAEKCKPFLADLELRAAYDAFRATQSEKPQS